ncbi:hypothetical protein AA0116_g8440 [Alternaria tenuissima]|jgi:pimeloyl-ACP methyl ester carboxylesterase|nr:hypothetical protein AA0116_g8440 [Alternaria tenuissima]
MADDNGLGAVIFEPSEPKKATVDIVFVHGLGGNRINTWTYAPGTPEKVFWPKDHLPQICPEARILSFGYNSAFAHFYPFYGPKNIPVGTTIDNHSTALFQSLIGLRDRTESTDRPIIFIAHSLGGLVVANALSRQHGADEAAVSLVNHTGGVVFLGTPFEGSSKAEWGRTALRVVDCFSDTKKEDVKDLEERSAKLVSINEAFLKFLKARDRSGAPVEVECFFEALSLKILGKRFLIVPKKSAVLPGIDGQSIEANHVDMCKFADEERSGFRSISEKLSQWIKAMHEIPAKTGDQVSRLFGIGDRET